MTQCVTVSPSNILSREKKTPNYSESYRVSLDDTGICKSSATWALKFSGLFWPLLLKL